MDTVTHALAGTALGLGWFRQREPGGRLAVWTCVAAAEFPDADIVMSAFGGETYLLYHRSFTHSVLLWPVWAAFVAGIFWAFAGKTAYRPLWNAALVGVASHIFLDWITSYGTLLWWPVSDARLALSWVFILDPYVWAMLGVTIWAAVRYRSARAARIGVGVVAGYFLMCGAGHAWACRDGHTAYAQPLNPFRWTRLRQVGETIEWTDGRQREVFTQYRDEQLVPAAEATSAVKRFRWFATFPLVERRTENGRTVLRYRDLRFRAALPWGSAREGLFVVAKVVFDENGKVLASGLTGEER